MSRFVAPGAGCAPIYPAYPQGILPGHQDANLALVMFVQILLGVSPRLGPDPFWDDCVRWETT